MTPITERLAEALRNLHSMPACTKQFAYWREWTGALEDARLALAEYDRLRTHPAEGGEGREPSCVEVVAREYKKAASVIRSIAGMGFDSTDKEIADEAIRISRLWRADDSHDEADICSRDILAALAAPPPQPVAPESYESRIARIGCRCTRPDARACAGDKHISPDFPCACECHVAPERGEAKAVAWRQHTPLDNWRFSTINRSADAGWEPLYATPQPPPAPTFRDPTIEDADSLREFYMGETSRSTAGMLDALKRCGFVVNAIGAKVGEK